MTAIEFGPLDFETGFTSLPDKPEVSVKILTDTLDPETQTGQRTRILKIDPGYENGAHSHPYFEELILLRGSFYEGDPTTGEIKHQAPAFARRSPGHTHGPLRVDESCVFYEVNWYGEDGG